MPPTGEENVQYFKDSFKKFDVKIPKEFDDNDYISTFNEAAFSTIKSITNDVVLRNGFTNITIKNIDDSIAYVLKKKVGRVEKPTYRAAIHEASHAFFAYLNQDILSFNRVGIENNEDPLCANRYFKREAFTYSEYITKIKFNLAGIIGEKVILKEGSADCDQDLLKASFLASKLGSCIGYKDLIANQVFLDNFSAFTKGNSECDKYSRKLIKKYGREVARLIKKNKKTIIKLADELYEKKRLKTSEILAFFEGEDIHK